MENTGSPPDPNIKATAFHEAGHCVAAIVYGSSIRYVTIIPGKRKNALGQVMLGRTLIRKPKGVLSLRQNKAEVNAHLMTNYAGAICQCLGTGKPAHPTSITDDHRTAKAMVVAFLGPQATPEAIETALRGIWQMTQEFCASPRIWQAVESLANALIAHRRINGGEVKRLVLQALDLTG